MKDHDGDLPFAPRGLSRVESARYVGVSPSLFDEMTTDGRMPKPIRVNRRVIWDRRRLDEAFDALDDTTSVASPYGDVAL